MNTIFFAAFHDELEKIAVSNKLIASAKERSLRQAAALMDSATHNRGMEAGLRSANAARTPESIWMSTAAGRKMRQAAMFGATPYETLQRVQIPAALKYKSTFPLENHIPASARAAQNTIREYDFRSVFPDAFKPVVRVKKKSSMLPKVRQRGWKRYFPDD